MLRFRCVDELCDRDLYSRDDTGYGDYISPTARDVAFLQINQSAVTHTGIIRHITLNMTNRTREEHPESLG